MTMYPVAKGADLVIPHTFTTLDEDGNEAPLDLTGYSAWWTLKENPSVEDTEANINHYWSELEEFGISLTDPESSVLSGLEDGILYNHITSEETSSLELGVVYHYDLWIRDSNGLDDQIEIGHVRIITPIRRRSTLAP